MVWTKYTQKVRAGQMGFDEVFALLMRSIRFPHIGLFVRHYTGGPAYVLYIRFALYFTAGRWLRPLDPLKGKKAKAITLKTEPRNAWLKLRVRQLARIGANLLTAYLTRLTAVYESVQRLLTKLSGLFARQVEKLRERERQQNVCPQLLG